MMINKLVSDTRCIIFVVIITLQSAGLTGGASNETFLAHTKIQDG